MPFVYASNVKANLGSLRNLPLKVETLHKSDISGHSICDLSRNISVVPNPQFPLNTELLTTLDAGYYYVFESVESDSKISVASATLALI